MWTKREKKKYHSRWHKALLYSHIRGRKGGKAEHHCPGNKAWGCGLADSLLLFSAYTLPRMTVFPTTWLAFSSTFCFAVQSLMPSSQCLLPSRSSEGGPWEATQHSPPRLWSSRDPPQGWHLSLLPLNQDILNWISYSSLMHFSPNGVCLLSFCPLPGYTENSRESHTKIL